MSFSTLANLTKNEKYLIEENKDFIEFTVSGVEVTKQIILQKVVDSKINDGSAEQTLVSNCELKSIHYHGHSMNTSQRKVVDIIFEKCVNDSLFDKSLTPNEDIHFKDISTAMFIQDSNSKVRRKSFINVIPLMFLGDPSFNVIKYV